MAGIPQSPRFYGRRHGRPLNPSRQHAYKEMDALYGIKNIEDDRLDPKLFFDENSVDEVWLEIGFGNGEHLSYQAEQNENIGLIGCEPFINGVSALYKTIQEEKIKNIRVWADDMRLLLEKIEPETIDRVFILFPDPWPKTRHHKRRIINQKNLDGLARILKVGSALRLATDHSGLAEWMLDECIAHDIFEWTAKEQSDWKNEPKDWIKTRYQKKGKAGFENWFIDCVKT